MNTKYTSKTVTKPWKDLINYSKTPANGKSPEGLFNINIFVLEVVLFIWV